jgi:hypothetical protein
MILNIDKVQITESEMNRQVEEIMKARNMGRSIAIPFVFKYNGGQSTVVATNLDEAIGRVSRILKDNQEVVLNRRKEHLL